MLQSSPFNFRRAVICIGRLILGGIFVYAGISKIFFPNTHLWPMFVLRFSISVNLTTFAQQVESYKLLSPAGVDFVAHTLPFTEIALGLLLLIGWRLKIWASLVTLSMLGFLTVPAPRSEEHTSELQSLTNLVCRLLLEKKKIT